MSAKVLILGLDAADRNLLLDWAHAGAMPTLRRLLEEGLSGGADAPAGLGNEAMWFSFCTGVNPARHGVHYFAQLKVGSYEIHPLSGAFIKHKPFWEPLSLGEKRVCVIDAPRIPLSNGINGVQLYQFMSHAPGGVPMESYPQALASDVLQHYGSFPFCPCSPPDDTLLHYGERDFATVRDLCASRLKIKAELAENFLQQDSWDLFFVTFAELHCIGHDCWHLHDPTHPRHDTALASRLGDPIKQTYQAADAAIGRILKRVDQETTVIIFAGPGMGPNYTANHMLNEILRRLGHSPVTTRYTAASAMRSAWQRFLPAALRVRLSRFVHRTRAGVLSAQLRDRTCFELNQQSMHGAIRVNLVGREPHGKVEPGAAFNRFCEELTSDLMHLRNLQTGAQVVREVLRTKEIYQGEYKDQLPDLLIVWNQEAPVKSIVSPKFGALTMENPDCRTGEHFDRTFFVIRGPGFSRGKPKEPVSVEDFAPSVAQVLGTALPDTDGRPIQSIGTEEIS